MVVQTADEPRFVVDCKVKPAALVGHVKITLAAEGLTVSCGSAIGNVRLNTVPRPELPPPAAVPYRVLPDKTSVQPGTPPSLLVLAPPDVSVKLCRVVNPVPSVLTANTVPFGAPDSQHSIPTTLAHPTRPGTAPDPHRIRTVAAP